MTHTKKARVKVFFRQGLDSSILERIKYGAGNEILRLPEYGDLPGPPSNDENSVAVNDSPLTDTQAFVTDWRAAEHFALQHMKEIGFTVARLTGGSRDKGIDIAHPHAVAQVKMQGVPVNAPLVQQLRGSRPDVEDHLFYSTSGYTGAAKAEAEAAGVALFLIDSVGKVIPVGHHAQKLLIRRADGTEGPEVAVAKYIQDVELRLRQAFQNYIHKGWVDRAIATEPSPGIGLRAAIYLEAAQEHLRLAPEIGEDPLKSILNYYRHTELLAAVYCREMHLGYPGSDAESPVKTLNDFY